MPPRVTPRLRRLPRSTSRPSSKSVRDEDGANILAPRGTPRQGNEAGGEGSEEIGALHSTREGGEPSSWGPAGGKGAPQSWTRWRER